MLSNKECTSQYFMTEKIRDKWY